MNKAIDTARLSSQVAGRLIDAGQPTALLFDGFAGLASKFGFSHFLVATFPRGDQAGFSGNLVLGNWPAALLEAYAAQDVFSVSALVANLKTTVLPVFAGSGMFFQAADQSEALAAVPAMFVEAGMPQTLAFSLHDADLNHYIVTLSGDRYAPSRAECMEIVFDCLTLLDERPMPAKLPALREKLTAREIECLRWSAAGKSSEEIAIILSISSHTVVSYLKSAMRKLDAVNRMQAIARACRYRLL